MKSARYLVFVLVYCILLGTLQGCAPKDAGPVYPQDVVDSMRAFEENGRSDIAAGRILFNRLFNLGFYSESADYARRCLELVPDDSTFMIHIARCAMETGDYDTGFAYVDKVLDKDSLSIDARMIKGLLYYRMAMIQEAAPYLLQTVSFISEDSQTQIVKALLLIEYLRGEYNEALRYGKMILRRDPFDPFTVIFTGRAYSMAGDSDKAFSLLSRSRDFQDTGDKAYGLAVLGSMLFGKGNLDAAYACFAEASRYEGVFKGFAEFADIKRIYQYDYKGSLAFLNAYGKSGTLFKYKGEWAVSILGENLGLSPCRGASFTVCVARKDLYEFRTVVTVKPATVLPGQILYSAFVLPDYSGDDASSRTVTVSGKWRR